MKHTHTFKHLRHSSFDDLVMSVLVTLLLVAVMATAGALDGPEPAPSPVLADAQHAARLQAQADRAARKACALGKPLYSEDGSFSCQLAQVARQ